MLVEKKKAGETRKKRQIRQYVSIVLLAVMVLSAVPAGPARAINPVNPAVWDASQKTPKTPLTDLLEKHMTSADAAALLAQGPYEADSLLVKVSSKDALRQVDLHHGTVGRSQELFSLPQTVGEAGTWLQVTVNSQGNLEDFMAELSQQKNVLAVEPDYLISLPETEGLQGVGGEPEAENLPAGQAAAPQDLNQPYLNGYGIPEGWDWLGQKGLTPGEGVVVAVIDSGVDYNHPDLKENILRHPDGSVWGESFVSTEKDLLDENGHGTHVAGIIAAANNGFGVTGVSYGAKIMPLKAFDKEGKGNSSSAMKAVQYAIVQGADVINLSSGGGAFSQAETDLLDLAASLGIVTVAAAGNMGAPNDKVDNQPEYAQTLYAPYYNVIGVMAEKAMIVEGQDRLASFSNWDSQPYNDMEFNLMAPGQNVFSTYLRNGYKSLNGTSMASPVVAGMAANLAGYVKAYGIDGNKEYSQEAKFAYLFSQLAGASPYQQGITYEKGKKPLQYREANQMNILTATPKPQMALLQTDGLLFDGYYNQLTGTLFNYHGSTKNTVITATCDQPGVLINNGSPALSGSYYDANNAGTVDFSFDIQADGQVPSGSQFTVHLKVTYENAKDPSDKTVYVLEEDVPVTFYHSQVLTQEALDGMEVLDDSKVWLINQPLTVKEGKQLNITEGAQVLFLKKGGLDVAGKMEVRGSLSAPVQMYTWASYTMLTEVENGEINTDYLIIRNPLLIASQVRHTDVVGDSGDLSQYVVMADDIQYCNFSDVVLDIYAGSMSYCQLANVFGEFRVRDVDHNVMISQVLSSAEGDLLLPRFIGASYALDLEQLRPVVDAQTGAVSIALPTSGGEEVAAFVDGYLKLLQGSVKGRLADYAVDGKQKEGTVIPVNLTVSSQQQADDLYQRAVFGDESSNGFSKEFYGLLRQLNSFQNNAVLGAVEFVTERQAAADKQAQGGGPITVTAVETLPEPKGTVYQLVLDNYWDLEHQAMLDYISGEEQLQKMKTPQQSFVAGENEQMVFAATEQIPGDVPPFQTSVHYEASQTGNQEDSPVARNSVAFDLRIAFNTEVLQQPAIFLSYGSFYGNGEEIPGKWLVSGGKSVWQGQVYLSGGDVDANLYQVSWVKDPWLTVTENQRFTISFAHDLTVADSKSYADQDTIIFKVYPDSQDRAAANGLYFYRFDQNLENGVLLNTSPRYPAKIGADKGFVEIQDTTAKPGQLYYYACLYASPGLKAREQAAMDQATVVAQLALNQQRQMGYSLDTLAGDETTIVTLMTDRPSFYGLADGKTAKIYYKGDVAFTGADKSVLSSHRLLASAVPGRDEKGSYIAVRVDPAYPCAIEAGGLIQLYFTGQGEFWLE